MNKIIGVVAGGVAGATAALALIMKKRKKKSYTLDDVYAFFGETELILSRSLTFDAVFNGIQGPTEDDTHEFYEKLIQLQKELFDTREMGVVTDCNKFVALMPELHNLVYDAIKWARYTYWKPSSFQMDRLHWILHETDVSSIAAIDMSKEVRLHNGKN